MFTCVKIVLKAFIVAFRREFSTSKAFAGNINSLYIVSGSERSQLRLI